MRKIDYIKDMADAILDDEIDYITPDELDQLLRMARDQQEKDLYINLYNYFLQKKSKETIANGRF